MKLQFFDDYNSYKEKKISKFQNNWGLKSVVKNAFQATQAEIASNMPALY